MDKSIESLLRLFALVLIFLILMGVAIKRISNLEKHIRELENAPADTVTLTHTDTMFIEKPVPIYKYVSKTEYVPVVKDSLITDTVTQLVFLPREYMVYKDTSYRAVVSGVQPRLDSIEIYQKNTVQTITKTIKVPDKKRWGLGVNVGAGWNGKEVQPYVGVGVQYNIIRW